MALTRKFLSAMGIESDKIDEIINAHRETVDGLKDEAEKYKADAEKLQSVQKELKEAREAMANGDKSPYKVKYEAKVEELSELQKKFDDFKADVEVKAITAKKTDAYRKLLKEAGVSEKRIDAVLRVSPIDDLEIDKDGNAKDADKLTEAIKSEWADFIVDVSEQGAKTATPPDGNGGRKVLTKEEILKIQDTSERQKAWADFLENERNK